MYIEDLSTEPRGPSAANMWARELEREHGPLVTRSVGWLGATVRSSGPVDPVILAALKHYTSWAYVEDGWMGFHTCEICNSVSSHGEVWIIWAGVRYILPTMTLHYITAHGYQPPEQFLKDLRDKWTTEGVLATEFTYGPKALERKLEARRARAPATRKSWWRLFW